MLSEYKEQPSVIFCRCSQQLREQPSINFFDSVTRESGLLNSRVYFWKVGIIDKRLQCLNLDGDC